MLYSDSNCLSDERCIRGICKSVCNADSKCGAKQICENRLCEIGCRSDTVCPDNEACINKKCQSKSLIHIVVVNIILMLSVI